MSEIDPKGRILCSVNNSVKLHIIPSNANGDGKYELTIRTTSVEKSVTISGYDLYRVNRNSGAVTHMYGDTSALSVRLCNASTGNCTAFKSFSQVTGSAILANMKAGIFYVDIRDSWASYYFKGTASAKTHSRVPYEWE